uniref:Peptidase S1 domain-containing protein n=1 Tax=Zonotrichia albicollis TaxID=44394 RepID=A0A8D2MD78_ZONAL
APFLPLPLQLCLWPSIKECSKIIGGRKVKAHSRPYMAYLEIQGDPKNYSCGGFLIRPDAVLSAAHCNVTVILGAHNRKSREQSQQKIRVRQWVIHPEYCPDDLKNDIVLLKLEKNAVINKNVKLISIPKENESVRVGSECNVPGWGRTSVRGQMSDVLMEVKLKVQKEEICKQFLPDYEPQSMICVGDENSKKAAYEGDSGGPLVCKKKAHGIVSHVCPCNIFPEVFTRISHFEPWIREQLTRFVFQDNSLLSVV